jgi:hypothetical protein
MKDLVKKLKKECDQDKADFKQKFVNQNQKDVKEFTERMND